MNTIALKAYVDELKEKGLYRSRSELSSPDGLNFSRNDYLGFVQNNKTHAFFIEALKQCPIGSTSSLVIAGYDAAHRSFEKALASFLHADDALLFTSGYLANLAIMSLVAVLNYHVLIDKGVHASTYDGIKLAQVPFNRYPHQDCRSLAQQLASLPDNTVVFTEGIFSMSGQLSDLHKIADICATRNIPLIVDEAHALGVIGPHGLGAVADAQLSQEQVPLRALMFGKALGFQGAAVVGQKEWIDALVQSARSYIYTTGMSPAVAHAMHQAFLLSYQSDEIRDVLLQRITYFRQGIKKSPLSFRDSKTPIQQLRLGCPHKALDYARHLKEKGIICQAIRPPTVSFKESGLRIVLNAHHTIQEIDVLLDALHALSC